MYVGHDEIPRVLSGLGISILNTSHGLMTDKEARRQKGPAASSCVRCGDGYRYPDNRSSSVSRWQAPREHPEGVTVNLSDKKLDVQGPKGKLSSRPGPVIAAKKDGEAISFTSSAPVATAPACRASLVPSSPAPSRLGGRLRRRCSSWSRRLPRRDQGKFITLALGFRHPTNIAIGFGHGRRSRDSRGHPAGARTSADKALLEPARGNHPRPSSGKSPTVARHPLPRREHIRRKAGKAAKGKGK